jgi:predicted Zn finger-like uncharacterized protein
MLFTRCPQCTTTFRVTEDALNKAGGRVRCGRCASVFDARAELFKTAATQPAKPSSAAEGSVSTPAEPEARPPGGTAGRAEHAPTALPVAAVRRDDPDDGAVAAIAAEIARGEADSAHEENGVSIAPISPALPDQRVDEVLAGEHSDASAATPIWTFESPRPRARSRLWAVGAALAVLALGVQGVHHFRAKLARQPAIGALVQRAYAQLGAPITPDWDVRQYQILDWVAAAEPNARGQGTLEIKARIHNRGPSAQPYPHVHVELKDRWDEIVGRRTFSPNEYLEAAASAMMAAGATVEARLDVVDPGPDAYGFELDVCVEAQRDQLTCGNDEIFLN